MQLRNRAYSYPVIVEGGQYYKDSTFTSSVSQSMDGYDIKLTLSVALNDKGILYLINAGDAVYVHHIECPQTCYRKVLKTKESVVETRLKDADVNGIVQICSFVVADKDIVKYSNSSFGDDYSGCKFDIEKGCIMAVGNQYNLRVEKQRDDLRNTSSIFSIVKNSNEKEDTMVIDLNKQKIVIALPENTYRQYCNIQSYADNQPIMHSMVIVPALIYCLAELRAAGSELDDYENYRWFRSLRKACGKINAALDEEGLKTINIVKVAQKLLNTPIVKAMEFFAAGGGYHDD